MITEEEFKNAQRKALRYLKRAGIVLTLNETKNIEVADFGLGNLEKIGLEIITYINTERYCAKELVLFPGQICPEHLHPDIDRKPGKEKPFVVGGELFIFMSQDKGLEIPMSLS
jgi:D-lyxose ketol-isomerase